MDITLYKQKKTSMKNFKLLICVVLAALAFASCSDTETYADMKKKERSAINRYITNKKINVISESQFEQQGCTTDTAKNEYVLFENTGVYMQIRSKGTGKKLKDGEDVDVTCRFNEYNLLEGDSALQLTNIYQYAWCTDKMNVKNTSGTFNGKFTDKQFSMMYTTYGSAAVPSGWLVPFTYINLGRYDSADAELAKVKLIVPHSQGQSAAAQGVYPCLYEITYERCL